MSSLTKKFLIGTSGWTYDEWVGKFYPKKCPRTAWLQYYAQQFDTVELNATFYRNFQKATYQHWYITVPENFRYVIKISRLITHRKYLLNVQDLIHQAENDACILKEKLGLILLQLPPSLPYDLDRLAAALNAFKDPTRVVVEFRNQQWFTEDTRRLLEHFKAVFCNVDAPRFRINNWLTSDIGFIRLHGRKLMYQHNYTQLQLQEIAEHAKLLEAKGAKEIYIFFNNTYEAHAPQNAKTLSALLC